MRTIKEAVTKVQETLDEKGSQYGPTYRKVALALSVPAQYSILVRILEKCMRLNQILMRPYFGPIRKDIANEFLDIACYSILALLESSPEEE